MSNELERQRQYWNSETGNFDAIYERNKGPFGNWLDNTFRWDMYERFDYTMRNSEPIAGRSFLDVGCGTGRYAMEFLRRGSAHVTGIDVAENMLEICRQRAAAEGFAESTDFVRADVIAFDGRRDFDISIGIGLFDYIGDALPVFARMRELSTVAAIASFPRSGSWRAVLRKARLSVKNCDVFFYSKDDVARLVKDAGFARFDMELHGELYCVTAWV